MYVPDLNKLERAIGKGEMIGCRLWPLLSILGGHIEDLSASNRMIDFILQPLKEKERPLPRDVLDWALATQHGQLFPYFVDGILRSENSIETTPCLEAEKLDTLPSKSCLPLS